MILMSSRIDILRSHVDEQEAHIIALEQRAAEATEDISRLTVFASEIGHLRNAISLQGGHIIALEKQVAVLEACAALNADEEQRLQVSANASVITMHSERIERLRAVAVERDKCLNRIEAEAIANLSVAAVEQRDRIERLEAALRDVVRCLIDGKVELMPDEFHSHRILGSGSVQAMVEVYHLLKRQMGDSGYDTS